MAAVKQNGEATQFASARLKDNSNIVMAAVKQTGWALGVASERLRDDADIVMAAVKQNGEAIHFASARLKDNSNIVMEAVKNHGGALSYASDRLRDDADIVLVAFKSMPVASCYASDRLMKHAPFVAQLIKFNDDDGPSKVTCMSGIILPLFSAYAVISIAKAYRPSYDFASFTQLQGSQAAQQFAWVYQSYCYERIWLLGQVSGHLPKLVIQLINDFSDNYLKRDFGKVRDLISMAPVICALDSKRQEKNQ